MNQDVKKAILLAIDALESCVDGWAYRGETEVRVRDFDDDKVAAALNALQALPWEDK